MNVSLFLCRKPQANPSGGLAVDLNTPTTVIVTTRDTGTAPRPAAVAPLVTICTHDLSACDEYFYLKHRNEQRGIGGLFFDDFSDGGFDNAFGLMQSVGNHYLPGFKPIVEKHAKTPFTVKQKGVSALSTRALR